MHWESAKIMAENFSLRDIYLIIKLFASAIESINQTWSPRHKIFI